MLKTHSPMRGFSLIELMVSIALMAILVMVAAPSLSTYTENSKLRGVAESFMAGVQNARAEAIRRNQDVEMVMTTADPVAANVATTALSATAVNWLVRANTAVPPALPTYAFVEGKSGLEGSGVDGTTSVRLTAATSLGAQSSISFDGTGGTALGAAWVVDFTSASAACAPAGPIRCLRVRVSPSGQAKSCDPLATGNDTRAC